MIPRGAGTGRGGDREPHDRAGIESVGATHGDLDLPVAAEAQHRALGGVAARAAGLAGIRSALEQWGTPTAGLVLDDGSGLSNENRVTCDAFVDVLGRSGPRQPLGAGLAVAGTSGTLADVFTDSPVTGRLRGKTVTLGNAPFNADPPAVKSLSGYLPVRGGGVITFSLLLNGPGPLTDQSQYRPIWDAFVATLAGYPSGPSPADLAPR